MRITFAPLSGQVLRRQTTGSWGCAVNNYVLEPGKEQKLKIIQCFHWFHKKVKGEIIERVCWRWTKDKSCDSDGDRPLPWAVEVSSGLPDADSPLWRVTGAQSQQVPSAGDGPGHASPSPAFGGGPSHPLNHIPKPAFRDGWASISFSLSSLN